MAEELIDKKLSYDDADRLTAELELDLVSFFKSLEQDILETIDDEKTVDQIIQDIDNLFKR